ncbi:uncharacterized protein LOC119853769 isoform X2 [Dermochelys coriacea]|uniref:uncharacterized protein LOC119853769 isoform X2 n=1 Tax=Dermochelys coriacea TaxID=27794 RepID=UPI0018E87157|nr:uncharacterized protein LOC119853769 isoform X2 [Dermochelys coriacea]
MKPGMCSPSDKAVVGATRTPPREPPKNQESALRPLTTQNITKVQMKHQDSPNLIYVKSKDKTKHSGKNHPCKHNSSSSAATATPSPEKTVSKNTQIHKPGAGTLGVVNKKTRIENSCDAKVLQPCKHNSSSSGATTKLSPEKTVSKNAHIHKPGAGTLGVVNKKTRIENSCDAKVLQSCKHNSSSSVATAAPSPEKTVSENTHIHKPRGGTLGALNACKTTHIHRPGAGALGVVNKKPRTDQPFCQNHKLVTDPPYSSIWEEFDASFRKLMDAVSSGV